MHFLTENKQSKRTIFTINKIYSVHAYRREENRDWLANIDVGQWTMSQKCSIWSGRRNRVTMPHGRRERVPESKEENTNVYRRATWYLVAIRLAFSMEITHNFLLAWKTVQRHSFIRYVYNGLKNAFDFRRQMFRNWYSLTANNRHFHWIVDLFFRIACRHFMNYENYRF